MNYYNEGRLCVPRTHRKRKYGGIIMDNTQTFSRGEIVFREGDAGDCMYELENGGVGVYHDYGGAKEKLISTLYNSSRELKIFGEMGLLEGCYLPILQITRKRNSGQSIQMTQSKSML